MLVCRLQTLRLWETSGAKVIDSWGDFAGVKPAASAAGDAGASQAAFGKAGKEGKKESAKSKADLLKAPGDSQRNIQQRM